MLLIYVSMYVFQGQHWFIHNRVDASLRNTQIPNIK